MPASLVAGGVARFEQIFEKSPNAYLLLAPDFTILACNAAYEQQVGLARDHLIGRAIFSVFPVADPAQRERLESSLAWVFRERRRHTVPLLRFPVAHVARLNGDAQDFRYWMVTHIPLVNAQGEVECVLSHPTDITELTRLRQAQGAPPEDTLLRAPEPTGLEEVHWVRGMHDLGAAERDYLQQLFKQAPGFICVLRGPAHIYELANDAYYQLIGHRDILGKPLLEALPEVVQQGFLQKLDQVYASGEPFVGRALPIQLQREAHGPLEERYIDLIYQPIREADDRVSGIFVQGHDVTEAHTLAQEVVYQAAHDPLTGLFNRRELTRQIAALREGDDTYPGSQGPHVLLYMDLDHFKIVNDRCGHVAGDELLRQTAEMFRLHVRSTDILARLGGDEFVIVLRDCPEEVAERIALHIREHAEALIFVWEGRRYGITLSTGIVSFGDALGVSFDTALSHADAACFLAKEKGRNRIQMYRHGDDEMYRQRRDMDWASRLRECMAEDRVVLAAQRIVSLAGSPTDEPQGWELLARLQEDHELVMPAVFIPAAERYGLMPRLDRHIIRCAFARWQGLPLAQRQTTRFFINLSGTTLSHDDLPEFIQGLLVEFPDLKPEHICFEVTETAAVSNLAITAGVMQQLVDQGFAFALDDFGSGMSSFSYLRQLPVQFVKIDGEFVRDLPTDPVNRAMVEAVVKVAHTMGIRVIAEFVESAEILQHLVKLGVDYGQGFGLHVPEEL